MQIVSFGDNLHVISNPIFWKKKNKKNITYLLSAEFAQTVKKKVIVKPQLSLYK